MNRAVLAAFRSICHATRPGRRHPLNDLRHNLRMRFLPILFAAASIASAQGLRVGAAEVTISPPAGTPTAGYYSQKSQRPECRCGPLTRLRGVCRGEGKALAGAVHGGPQAVVVVVAVVLGTFRRIARTFELNLRDVTV